MLILASDPPSFSQTSFAPANVTFGISTNLKAASRSSWHTHPVLRENGSVGGPVGNGVGKDVGDSVGWNVGGCVGAFVGAGVVGLFVGNSVGEVVGTSVKHGDLLQRALVSVSHSLSDHR